MTKSRQTKASGGRKVKLELTVSEAVALYYAAGALRDDIIRASDKTTNHPSVSGARKTDRLILKSLDMLAAAIRKATALLTALVIVAGIATARAELLTSTLRHLNTTSQWHWPMYGKVLIGFWLAIAFFFFVLAGQRWWARRRAIQSRALRHGNKRK